ncbi:MAG: phosphoribosylaminoimidazolesuccinocarboxamide synthase [Syntrophomonadaceae bacterium]|nr:phosphoribosylaminoimidazolesuccinocarboxamide synthase [Syntrophomonadaceae bacterium]
MVKLEQIYEGKAKKVFRTDQDDRYIIEFKDEATAFNGKKKGVIANKGVLNNAISSHFFRLLESQGIPTHFLERLNDRDMLVKSLKIVPVEVIVRNVIAGSLAKRVGLPEGTLLEDPVLEFYYKSDELGDPMINEYHIAAMKLADSEQMEEIKALAVKVNEVLKPYLRERGIELVDFKLEFGVHNGKILLGDEISPDTCRFWDLKTQEKLDKDRFRRDLGRVEEAYAEIWQRLNSK